jgi:CheY-like chemotaxis protein
VTIRTNEGDATVEVADTGIGIDPEFLPHVFERFRQADSSTSRAHSGLGLGLSIVRHLVEAHGGEVYARSEGLGRGASFGVVLPTLTLRAAADESRTAAPPMRGHELEDARILVVDDEEEVRNYVGAVLRMSSAEVRCAASAADAFEILRSWKPDLIVSDIGMPVADGYEFLRRVRSDEGDGLRDVPVIALTAYARPEDRQRALRAGFDAFVSKPVEPEALRAAIAESMRE